MEGAKLSPDGHTVAFGSPVGGTFQVFVMLTSGGDPPQLTSDEGDKEVAGFSSDGGEIFYERSLGNFETWGIPTLGGATRKVLEGFAPVPSLDGNSLFYVSPVSRAVLHADKTGLGAEQVFKFGSAAGLPVGLLVYPGGDALWSPRRVPIRRQSASQSDHFNSHRGRYRRSAWRCEQLLMGRARKIPAFQSHG